MKHTIKRLFSLLMALCFTFPFFPGALAAQDQGISGWAYEEVTAAIEEDLVPHYLQMDYQKNIIRQNFCELVIQALLEGEHTDVSNLVLDKTGKDLDTWLAENPFTDTTYYNIVAAYALGIVNGRGGGIFDPYATITRQEAAAFLTRTAKVMGLDTTGSTATNFTDQAHIGIWFTDAVNFVCQNQIMQGTGNNQFSPLGFYTREQSFVTIYRLFQAAYPDEITPSKPDLPQEIPTQADAWYAIFDLETSYPEGMRWTNDNFYYSQSLGIGGYGCEGFALICSDAAFGGLPITRTHSNYEEIKVGDIIRIGDRHTVVALGWLADDPDTLCVVEGNFNSSIHWGRLITRTSLEQEGFTVRTRYPADT